MIDLSMKEIVQDLACQQQCQSHCTRRFVVVYCKIYWPVSRMLIMTLWANINVKGLWNAPLSAIKLSGAWQGHSWSVASGLVPRLGWSCWETSEPITYIDVSASSRCLIAAGLNCQISVVSDEDPKASHGAKPNSRGLGAEVHNLELTPSSTPKSSCTHISA